MTWYVVTERWNPEPDDAVWTLTENPEVSGWVTDHGYYGYGLTWEKATYLAKAVNFYEQHQTTARKKQGRKLQSGLVKG